MVQGHFQCQMCYIEQDMTEQQFKYTGEREGKGGSRWESGSEWERVGESGREWERERGEL